MSKNSNNRPIWDKDGYEEAPAQINTALEHSTPATQKDLANLNIPTPSEVKKHLKKQRITIMLRGETIEKFKSAAAKHDTKYQTLISSTLDAYSRQLK